MGRECESIDGGEVVEKMVLLRLVIIVADNPVAGSSVCVPRFTLIFLDYGKKPFLFIQPLFILKKK